MKKIAVLDDYQRVAQVLADWSDLEREHEVTVFHDHLADPDAVARRLEPFHVICVMRERTPLPAELIARLPNLELIVTTGGRNASIDVAAARERGITVCGTGIPGHATAELTVGLMIALARDLIGEVDSVRAGGWQRGLGRDLRGRTLGVIGLGRLGSQVAAVARTLGMEVIAWSQNLTAEKAEAAGATLVGKDELFSRADYITIHLRLSERTRGLVDAAAIGRMKRDAFLINTSRGPIVDNGALLAALRDGRIGGAALDVYDIEPLPAEDPRRGLPNLLATPHIGYVTRETYRVFYPQTVEAIEAWLAGKPVRVIEP